MELALVCSFCGCQQPGRDRCANCGAASLAVPAAAIRFDSPPTVKKERKSKSYFFHFTVALAAGLLVKFCTISDLQVQHAVPQKAVPMDTNPYGKRSSFAFLYAPTEVQYSKADIRHKLAAISSKYEFYYTGLNRPEAPGKPVMLNVQNTSANIVLVLSSFKPIHWHVSNPHVVNIIAIVYASDAGRSTVSGDLSSAMILPGERPIGTFYQPKQCSCSAPGYYKCTGNDVQSMMQVVESLGNAKLTGVANYFSASSLRVPQSTSKRLLQLDKLRQRSNEQLKTQCFKDVSQKSSSFFIPTPR